MDIHSDKLKLDWRFPLPKTHDGILLGNGLFGVAVWGDDGGADKNICRGEPVPKLLSGFSTG